ncbi:unnamed protein product, partial [Nesidiocoris tenuis]
MTAFAIGKSPISEVQPIKMQAILLFSVPKIAFLATNTAIILTLLEPSRGPTKLRIEDESDPAEPDPSPPPPPWIPKMCKFLQCELETV